MEERFGSWFTNSVSESNLSRKVFGAELCTSAGGRIRTQLLMDIRAILQPEGEPAKKALTGTVICGALNGMEDRMWGDISGKNSGITPRKLSDLLRPFHIEPHSDGKRRLYRVRDFVPVFERYLND